MITIRRFRRLERAVRDAGFSADIAWAEGLDAPVTPEQFAEAGVYVIVNSGMKYAVAQTIFARCREELHRDGRVTKAFGHPGKTQAINAIWEQRDQLFDDYQRAEDTLEFCASLPWVGPVTKFHLAKDLGADVAKPDVHVARLARAD